MMILIDKTVSKRKKNNWILCEFYTKYIEYKFNSTLLTFWPLYLRDLYED